MAYSKPSYRDITSFSYNFADFPPLSSQSSTVNSSNSLQSSKLSSNSNFSNRKYFADSVLKCYHSRFLLGKTSAQDSCFSPSAHKSSVTSVPVKNFSSFSSNSANSLCSRACLAICNANSNPKSNLFLKNNSKSHILPVSIKSAIPVSLSNFCVSSTLSNSSGAMVQKHSFDSHSFKSSSFTNSPSQLSFCRSKFSSPKIPTTPKSFISVSPTNHNNFSSSIPYFIKSNDSKPACAPHQTSYLSPFSIKSPRGLLQSSTQACQSIVSQNQKEFNSGSLISLFEVSELPFQLNATATLPIHITSYIFFKMVQYLTK